MREVVASLAAVLLLVGCKPSTIAEAERKGDVTWLDQVGSRYSLSGLHEGRSRRIGRSLHAAHSLHDLFARARATSPSRCR
jgi:hypothetical protein